MSSFHRAVPLVAAALSFCLLPSARSQTPGAEILTIDRALELAERNNPSLATADANRAIADAGILTAKGRPNPDFNFLGGHQHAKIPSTIPGGLEHYGVSQLIELPSVRRARIRAAGVGRETTEFARQDSGLSVTADVKFAFYEVLRRQGLVTVAQDALALLADLKRRIQVQVDVGEAARLELTRAEAEEATSQTQVRSAELEFLNSLSVLRTVVGGRLPEQITVQGTLSPPVGLPPMDELKQQVLSTHPALEEAQAEVRLAEAQLNAEKELRKPQPYVTGEFERQPDLNFFRFGVALPLPIWNRREGPIAEARARVERANSVVEGRSLELTAQVEQAYNQYQITTQKVASYEQGVLRETEASVRAAEAAWRLGQRGILEVLDAQRVFRAARKDYLDAQYDRQNALTELDRLRGEQFGRGGH